MSLNESEPPFSEEIPELDSKTELIRIEQEIQSYFEGEMPGSPKVLALADFVKQYTAGNRVYELQMNIQELEMEKSSKLYDYAT